MKKTPAKQKVRYAVVGLGHIAQAAVLPAFKNASKNSELTAFVSGDPVKHRTLGKRYGVDQHCSYAEYDELMESGEVDAVYIALPNSMHHEFTLRAARAGIHVLCEKPLAISEKECREMIAVCAKAGVRLMTAYRLHFERTNLEAVELVRSGRIGNPQIFHSVFTMQVRKGNIRVKKEMGGGTLYDIGIYCINAARYLFRSEPEEVVAFSVANTDARFHEVDAMTSAILRFPGDRLACFSSSFASSDVATYHVIGTKGSFQVDMAYEYAAGLELRLTVDGKEEIRTFSPRDQFAAELLYFSDCILKKKEPEPSGEEGLADVRIVEALYQSAKTGRPVRLGKFVKKARPSLLQEIRRPAIKQPKLVRVQPPTEE